MRIHEIITELDPSRRSFLKTVGKTAVGVAGAAALGNLATRTASANTTKKQIDFDDIPEVENSIQEIYRAFIRMNAALEMFKDNPNEANLALCYKSHRMLRTEITEFQTASNIPANWLWNPDRARAIYSCRSGSKTHICGQFPDLVKRFNYLQQRTEIDRENVLSQYNKKKGTDHRDLIRFLGLDPIGLRG